MDANLVRFSYRDSIAMLEAQYTAPLVLPSQLLILSGPTLLLLCGLLFLKLYLSDQPKQDHYVTGLDNDRRTLAEARKHMVSNCAEMMLEGYERTKTGFFRGLAQQRWLRGWGWERRKRQHWRT